MNSTVRTILFWLLMVALAVVLWRMAYTGGPSASTAELGIMSNPPGADIQLDGTFVGNTPSSIGVSAGDHTIDVSKAGYKTWERKIKITTGKIDIAADLEAVPISDQNQKPTQ